MLACVLAGGEQTGFTPEGKAFARIHGKQMIDYVVEALAGASGIDNIIIVQEQGRLIDGVATALKQSPDPSEYLLIVTCDVPFLTSQAVEDFLDRCRSDADLYYPIVDKRVHEQRFPGVRRTFVKLKDGTFTGGNLFLVKPAKLLPLLERVERLLELRKSPLALSAELGLRFVFSLLFSKLTGMLTIERLESRVAELFQIDARAVISPYPEIANDIDRPDDLRWAQKMLSG
ncbi:NTP transferase domain-containing protein [Effusibacillus pohliae]|uniref:NTP transferase domain-containing protein n=1 Tax=Effusibacillus pohliae TaxID=232270 RepID=UPI000367C9F6|nr:NTP transferase domain-containing protein [Effusibacillus pohliae]